MSILDEILYLSREYRDRYHQAPTTLLINNSNYQRLCDELNKDEVQTIHGLSIEVTGVRELAIEY